MLISKSMTSKVLTIDQDSNAIRAKAIMSSHRIRHLPVVEEDDVLIGIVTDRDIRSVMPFMPSQNTGAKEEIKKLSELKIRDMMTRDPYTISVKQTIQDALLLFQKTRVGAFPVIDANHRVVGIISESDLLAAFIRVMGIGEPGTLLGIVVDEGIDQMKRVINVITNEGIAVGSILVVRNWEKGRRAVYPYLFAKNINRLKNRLKLLGYDLIDPRSWNVDNR